MRIKNFLQVFVSAVLLSSLSVSALAQQPSTPSINRLRQIITYLASDALEGRRTGTPGANEAAHYIAGEFNRLGLRPGMRLNQANGTRPPSESAYLQPFPFVSDVALGNKNTLTITTDGVLDAPKMT